MTEKTIKITLTKSVIGALPLQRRVVEALGLRKINHTVERPDTPETRGAVEKVKHLVRIEEV
jgi:large subunit ribosomal protein L30